MSPPRFLPSLAPVLLATGLAAAALPPGDHDRTMTFGGATLTSLGGADIFVAKYDAAGNHLWSKRFGDAAIAQQGRGIAADVVGNATKVTPAGHVLPFAFPRPRRRSSPPRLRRPRTAPHR